MQLNWTELLKSTMVMFAVIDIVGSIPFLLDIKKKAGDIHAEKASLVALGIMLAFLFLGEGVINFLGIDVTAVVRLAFAPAWLGPFPLRPLQGPGRVLDRRCVVACEVYGGAKI